MGLDANFEESLKGILLLRLGVPQAILLIMATPLKDTTPCLRTHDPLVETESPTS
jgi:hypothetical protein